MKITKLHLRKIIQEALEEADNPCWDGHRPGAQSGQKTKIGKRGNRVPNCEKISEADTPLAEQELAGPDLARGKDFAAGGSGEGKVAAMASYDEMYYDLVDDYYAWVDKNGHITPSASSVMASYFLEKGLEDDHKKHKMLSKAFAVSHNDIMADVRRQKAERSAMMGEAAVRITKKQLRKIIKEAILLEEPADYYRDYKAGTITRKEYEELVRQFEMGHSGRRSPGSSDPKPTRSPVSKPEKKWKGTQDELYQRVAEYLVDIGFYKPFTHRDGKVYANLMGGSGGHPKGGFTSNIPDVLRAGVESGEIDWATYDEMHPVYRKMDRAID